MRLPAVISMYPVVYHITDSWFTVHQKPVRFSERLIRTKFTLPLVLVLFKTMLTYTAD